MLVTWTSTTSYQPVTLSVDYATVLKQLYFDKDCTSASQTQSTPSCLTRSSFSFVTVRTTGRSAYYSLLQSSLLLTWCFFLQQLIVPPHIRRFSTQEEFRSHSQLDTARPALTPPLTKLLFDAQRHPVVGRGRPFTLRDNSTSATPGVHSVSSSPTHPTPLY